MKRPKSSNNEGQQHKLLVSFSRSQGHARKLWHDTPPSIAKYDISDPKLQTIAHAFFDKLYLAVPKEQVERSGLDEGAMTGIPRRMIYFHQLVTAYNFQELHNIAGSARSGIREELLHRRQWPVWEVKNRNEQTGTALKRAIPTLM